LIEKYKNYWRKIFAVLAFDDFSNEFPEGNTGKE